MYVALIKFCYCAKDVLGACSAWLIIIFCLLKGLLLVLVMRFKGWCMHIDHCGIFGGGLLRSLLQWRFSGASAIILKFVLQISSVHRIINQRTLHTNNSSNIICNTIMAYN